MNVPLTEIEIATRVYAHPLIKAYDKALSKLHSRHTAAYGSQFMDEPEYDADGWIISEPGIHRWTKQEEEAFTNLYSAAQKMRKHVRDNLPK
jgi:hypothetical protein